MTEPAKKKPKPSKRAPACVACGKPGADRWVVADEGRMKGPYHDACKPK